MHDILDFTINTNFHDFENDKMKRFAVERQLLVIGEAANHLSVEFRTEYSNIPWKLMIGFRNIIAHEYGEILVERIYRIVVDSIKPLKENVEALLK